MTWDPSRPANDVEISALGQTTFRPFWDAIETASDAASTKLRMWGVNLIDRSTIGGNNTPNRIDNTGIIYCRNDGTNNELFFLDSQNPANEIQLTANGNIGSTNTNVTMNGLTFDGTSPFVIRWALYTFSAGTTWNLTAGSPEFAATASSDGAGKPTLTFTMTTAMANVNYAVIAQPNTLTGGNNGTVCDRTITSTSTFTVRFYTAGNGNVTAGAPASNFLNNVSIFVMGQA